MKIVGLVGFKGSGKDSASTPLLEQGFQKTSFAGVLKDCCSAIFGWDRDMLEGTTGEARLKREETDLWWAEKLGRPGFSPRRAFTSLGTDVIRTHFNENIWVLAVENQIRQGGDWVLTDCRFPNELQMVKDLGGTIIRVKRGPEPEWYRFAEAVNNIKDKNDRFYQEAAAAMTVLYKHIHISEWAWAGSPLIEHTIENDGSLEELHAKVNRIVG